MADNLVLTPRTRQLLLIAADLLFDEGREDLDQDNPNPWACSTAIHAPSLWSTVLQQPASPDDFDGPRCARICSRTPTS
jgi:hypothetical protein